MGHSVAQPACPQLQGCQVGMLGGWQEGPALHLGMHQHVDAGEVLGWAGPMNLYLQAKEWGWELGGVLPHRTDTSDKC